MFPFSIFLGSYQGLGPNYTLHIESLKSTCISSLKINDNNDNKI